MKAKRPKSVVQWAVWHPIGGFTTGRYDQATTRRWAENVRSSFTGLGPLVVRVRITEVPAKAKKKGSKRGKAK